MPDIDESELVERGAIPPTEFHDAIERLREIAEFDLEVPNDFDERLSHAIDGLVIPPQVLRAAAAAIRVGHVVLQGPPGTGKSSLVRALAKAFNASTYAVTAHEDWTIYDVIGRLELRLTEDRKEEITPVNGALTEAVIRCGNNIVQHFDDPAHPQAEWLLIDELNRAHLDKAFGELFSVLGTDELVPINLPHQKEGNRELVIPRRFRIIATLNSYDNLLSRLNATIAPPKSAEALKAQWYRHWIANRLRRDPWRDVCNSSSPQRLRMETSRRIARRQTGNEYAYTDLLQLIDDWRLIGSELGGAVNTDKFTRAFLAFPSDEGFLDRIFEIWCLRELASALTRHGAHLVDGPQPLTVNRSVPIYTFLLEGKQVEIWFQKSLPKAHARWTYDIADQPLRGIPDITVIADGTHYLLVDAKNRNVQRGTRPEETYKILGYFENFRSLLDDATNWAILSFVSFNGFAQQLTSIGGRKLLLTSAHPMTHDECSFSSQIDSGLVAWINTWNPSA